MLPLIAALAALQATPAPPAAAASPTDPESRCAYIIREATGIHPGEDPNLHVLAQTAADGPFAPVKPAGAVGIQCWRASIVPAAHDEKVILAHLALIIAETDGPSPHRIGALDYRRDPFPLHDAGRHADARRAGPGRRPARRISWPESTRTPPAH